MESVKIKVNAINNLSDARYCAGMGVDLIGFDLRDTSEQNVLKVQAMKSWLAGVTTVGEFNTYSADELENIDKLLDFDYLEIPLTNPFNAINFTKPIIIRVQNYHELEIAKQYNPAYINWEIQSLTDLDSILLQENYIITGSFANKNIQDVLKKYPILAVGLHGGNEIKPGIVDSEELADIIELLIV